jgi:flagellar basal body-associated protein FliL
MDNTKINKRAIFLRILVLLVIFALFTAGYFYMQVRKLKQDPNVLAKQEVNDLVEKIGKFVILPTGEVPTLATVSDPEALKDQPFFTNAVKGDQVLIYSQAKKAILYSVEQNKIIDMTSLSIDNKNISAPEISEPQIPEPIETKLPIKKN